MTALCLLALCLCMEAVVLDVVCQRCFKCKFGGYGLCLLRPFYMGNVLPFRIIDSKLKAFQMLIVVMDCVSFVPFTWAMFCPSE